MIEITATLRIAEQDLHEEFVRSSGPGGQNVNKVATTVQLRFDVQHAALPEDVKTRLRELAGKRLTEEGILLIQARRFRTQERNRQEARERLIALLQEAAAPPSIRHPTRTPRVSRQRRLDAKHHRAQIKRKRFIDREKEE